MWRLAREGRGECNKLWWKLVSKLRCVNYKDKCGKVRLLVDAIYVCSVSAQLIRLANGLGSGVRERLTAHQENIYLFVFVLN